MTRYEKIAISLPIRAAETARRAVRLGKATSVSAYVATAIEEYASRDGLAALLDEMLEETGGPMTAAERRAVDKILDHGQRRPRSKRRKATRSRR